MASSRSSSRIGTAQFDEPGVVGGDDDGGHSVVDHQMGHERRVALRQRVLELVQPGGLADGATALAVPAALPDPRPQLGDPAGFRGRALPLVGALEQPELGEVAGDLGVGR